MERTRPGLELGAHNEIAASPTTIGHQSVLWTPDTQNEAAPSLSWTRPRHWRYISEGGATIVFSYRGPAHPVFSNSVLRLRKSVRTRSSDVAEEVGVGNSETVKDSGTIVKPLELAEDAEQKVRARGSNESLKSNRSAHSSRSVLLHRSNSRLRVPGSDSEDDDDDWEDVNPDSSADEQPDDPTIAFQTRVTSKLVPLCYLPRLETARVGQRWIEELARVGEQARPKERREVDGIDVTKRKGVLADDLVGWEGWAAEIKPKWGFLPNGAHLSEETSVYKLSKCRFCMHTYHGSKADKVRGEYCPLDLFSGDEARIRKALGALWDTWVESDGKINNLKIFVKGKAVKPQSDPRFGQLLAYLPGQDGAKDGFVKTIARMLQESPLLTTLSTLMRSLDALDIEGIEKLWKTAKHFSMAGLSPPIAEDEDEPSLVDWEKLVDEYLVHGPYVGSGERYDPAQLREEDLRYWLLCYLMSATFKDCSIMLRFPPGQVEGSFFNPERDMSMPLLTAIDLDPKSVKRLQKWVELDRKIVESYAAAVKAGVAEPGRCEDGCVIGDIGAGRM